MRYSGLLALIVLLFVGCAPSAFHAYLAKPDQFQPDKVFYFSDHVAIKPVQFGSTGFSFFELNYVKTSSTEIWYVQTYYNSSDWLFVESMMFNIDGHVYKFSSTPSPKRETGVMGSAYVAETNQFTLSDEFLAALERAQVVAVRLEGQYYYQDKNLEPQDIKNLNWFVSYVREQLKVRHVSK